MRTLRAFVMGAGAAFFLDPRQGRRRRNVARDQVLAVGRRSRRRLAKRTRMATGRVRGLAASARPARERELRTDSVTVAQRIRSDAFREAGVSTRAVEIQVDDGVVSLLGTVPSDEAADALVTRVADTPGVRDVAAVLRVERSRAA